MRAAMMACGEKFSGSLLKTIIQLIFMVGLLGLGLQAQKTPQARPPVTTEDLAMSDLPEFPGAPAVCLYYEKVDDREKNEASIFKRIKILTPAGRDYANLEILHYAFLNEVKDIKVRVYEADGSSREVKPEIMEKIASKLGESEYRVKTLAIPDVSPGQIIDYEYKIGPKENAGSFITIRGDVLSIRINLVVLMEMPDLYSSLGASWDLQDSIYIRKARYRFVSHSYVAVAKGGKYNMSWVASNLGNVKPSFNDKGLELEISDIPPFYKEEFMPPESKEKITFKVFYLDPAITSNQEYWEKASLVWKKSYEDFMAGEKGLRKELQAIAGTESDPELKLKKIYQRVQQIKNLNYVPVMSEKEKKKIKDNRNAADVLKNNYGYKNEIVRTFAAMARAAGFETYLVRVVDRSEKLFNPNLPLFYGQFDSEIVMVKVGSAFRAFDPGLPSCSYGLVYWPRSGTTALTFENERMKIFTSPPSPPEDAVSRKKSRLRPDGAGNLAGDVRIEYYGQEALSRKITYKDKDEVKIKEELEKELLKVLPPGSEVNLENIYGLTENSAELAADYQVAIAGVIHRSGDRLILPLYALTRADRYPFRSAFRNYPVYIDYPYIETDELFVEIPEGYEVEAIPEVRARDSERSSFFLKAYLDEPGQLRIERRLSIKKSLFPVSEYIDLKEFFDYVQSRDERQIILKKK